MKIKFSHNFETIIGMDNLLEAWKEFLKGKRNKRDVQEFSFHLMDNLFLLHKDLSNHTYKHGGYQAFNICDPKPRNIHKANVRDRLIHHTVYRVLYPFFDKVFITDSYSCRIGKGTHKAIKRFREFYFKVSKNNTRTCWVLKCDIRKFFANIDHKVLIEILKQYIADIYIIWLFREIIESFSSTKLDVGLPLGNLTSQLFVNIYMNEFDRFVKHKLKIKHYIRYADDFIIFSDNREWLEKLISPISDFLDRKLKLKLHPEKIFIKTGASGVDFLGWVHFPDNRILRPVTKRRMIKRIEESLKPATLNSYFGLMSHGNTQKLQREVYKNYLLAKGSDS